MATSSAAAWLGSLPCSSLTLRELPTEPILDVDHREERDDARHGSIGQLWDELGEAGQRRARGCPPELRERGPQPLRGLLVARLALAAAHPDVGVVRPDTEPAVRRVRPAGAGDGHRHGRR